MGRKKFIPSIPPPLRWTQHQTIERNICRINTNQFTYQFRRPINFRAYMDGKLWVVECEIFGSLVMAKTPEEAFALSFEDIHHIHEFYRVSGGLRAVEPPFGIALLMELSWVATQANVLLRA